MSQTILKNLKQKLLKAANIKTPYKRNLKIAAIVAEALRTTGRNPIVVGGMAVEIYTRGGYSTQDIDMICPGGIEVAKTMKSLGFENLGKDFIYPNKNIYIEFPGSKLDPQEKFETFEIDKLPIQIISIEDLIIDRINAFKFWKATIDGANALMLLESDQIDETRLKTRAKQEDVLDALKALIKLREEIIRKKLSKKSANALLEKTCKELSSK